MRPLPICRVTAPLGHSLLFIWSSQRPVALSNRITIYLPGRLPPTHQKHALPLGIRTSAPHRLGRFIAYLEVGQIMIYLMHFICRLVEILASQWQDPEGTCKGIQCVDYLSHPDPRPLDLRAMFSLHGVQPVTCACAHYACSGFVLFLFLGRTPRSQVFCDRTKHRMFLLLYCRVCGQARDWYLLGY